MVWYPSAEDIVRANKIVVRQDKHSHKLRRSLDAIRATIQRVEHSEHKGLSYQAALLMKEFTMLHAFDGGNHRTAYSVAILFLIENGAKVRVVPASLSYAFSKRIATKQVEEIQDWIESYMLV